MNTNKKASLTALTVPP